MKSTVLSIAILAVLYLGLFAQGKNEVKPVIDSPSEATLKQIAASGEKERLAILDQLSNNRSDLERRLINALNAATEKDKKFAFVYLMGLYRLEETVWALARVIDLENEVTPNNALPLLSRYPAVDALLRIGQRSVPAMLDNIKAAKGEKITELSVDVIQHIESPAFAKMILEEAITKEADPVKKKHLQDSLKYLKKE